MKHMLNLSENTKNILLMVAGVILLLHALGIFACSLTTLVIIVALAMIATGFVRGGYWDKAMGLIGKN